MTAENHSYRSETNKFNFRLHITLIPVFDVVHLEQFENDNVALWNKYENDASKKSEAYRHLLQSKTP